MKKLYFENSYGERKIIAEVSSRAEAIDEIYNFCNDRNFKIYYVRSCETPEGFVKYDVGSWSEFFYLEI